MIFLVHGECLKKLKELDNDSVDALITDPPAGISFMNKSWDDDKGGRDSWIKWMSEIMAECLRVMKPGAHGLVWAIPRTSHWTATALEDAGFEVRDIVTHLFGTGFPKSLNISKAIDKELGKERKKIKISSKVIRNSKSVNSGHEIEGGDRPWMKNAREIGYHELDDNESVSEEAKQYDGYGTALKPASEHWILIRKPLSEKTVAKNVLKYGTGGINIDACRIEATSEKDLKEIRSERISTSKGQFANMTSDDKLDRSDRSHITGRFPANLVLSHNADCEYIGTKEVKVQSGSNHIKTNCGNSIFGKIEVDAIVHHENGKETVADYKCTEGCAVAALDEQSGILKSGSIIQGQICKPRVAKSKGAEKERILNKRDSSEGGASRFFKTIQPNPEWNCTEGCAVAALDEQSGILKSGKLKPFIATNTNSYSGSMPKFRNYTCESSQGGASRFFYCSKAPKSDKGEDNNHPTPKNTKLMEYLITLITPEEGIVLDPFMGSGSTGIACINLKKEFIGIEKELEYFKISETRAKKLSEDVFCF